MAFRCGAGDCGFDSLPQPHSDKGGMQKRLCTVLSVHDKRTLKESIKSSEFAICIENRAFVRKKMENWSGTPVLDCGAFLVT